MKNLRHYIWHMPDNYNQSILQPLPVLTEVLLVLKKERKKVTYQETHIWFKCFSYDLDRDMVEVARSLFLFVFLLDKEMDKKKCFLENT